MPPAIGLYIVIVLHVAGYVWYEAAISAHVADLEKRQEATESIISRLSVDYSPRLENAEKQTALDKLEASRDARLDRVESKLDLLLLNHVPTLPLK
jgi:hypothetical protein